MNRFQFAFFPTLIEHVRRCTPNLRLTIFARVAFAIMCACWSGQAVIAQTENISQFRVEPTSFGSPSRFSQLQVVPAIPIAVQSSRPNSEPNSKTVQERDGSTGNRQEPDDANWSSKFNIASVNEPIGPTPFSKLKLPSQPPIESGKEAAVSQFGKMPVVFSPATYFIMASAPESQRTFAWKSPDFYHRPLYFEDANLERYGHYVPLVQPAISAVHFFGRVPNLAYQVGTYPPCEPTYTYGYYRPGSCNPHRLSRPPLSFQGLLLKGVAVTGLVFALP